MVVLDRVGWWGFRNGITAFHDAERRKTGTSEREGEDEEAKVRVRRMQRRRNEEKMK